MKLTKRGCLLSGCLTPILAIAFSIIISSLIPSAARKALPSSARNIQEHYIGGFHPDFVRLLKAELPEEDLSTYLSNLNLTVKYDPEIHSKIKSTINIRYGDAPNWWDEPHSLDQCYFDYTQGDEYLKRVKWKNGWVYFSVTSW
jgi:hypothetical protein